MRQVIMTARNISHMIHEGKSHAVVEAIIVLAEPEYVLDAVGGTTKTSRVETVRFECHPKTMREIAERFIEWADQADDETDSIIVRSEPTDA